MKKFLSLLLLSSLALAACQTSEAPVVENVESTEIEVTVQNDEYGSLKDKIEDLSGYTVLTEQGSKDFVPTCDAYSEGFAEKVKAGEVKVITLFASEFYGLALLSTPNYDEWTEADFDKVNKCGELGSVTAQKIVSDRLLWAYPRCSAGFKPNEDDSRYGQFLQCVDVEEQLAEYLKN